MVEIKTPGEIQAMRAAGRVVAKALAATREHAAVGMTLK
jgi:methionyl aminopeptidase